MHKLFLIISLMAFTGNALGASHTTPNFIVYAEDPEAALNIAYLAEGTRKLVARELTGADLPDWTMPVAIHAHIMAGSRGWTTTLRSPWGGFTFQRVTLQGSKDDLINFTSHEVCHLVVHRLVGDVVPKWMDEGLAVRHEGFPERRGEKGWGRAPLPLLFAITSYPKEYEQFYAQSFSVTEYLIEKHDGPTLLKFVKAAVATTYEEASPAVLGCSLVELDRDWRAWHEGKYGWEPSTSTREKDISHRGDGPGSG